MFHFSFGRFCHSDTFQTNCDFKCARCPDPPHPDGDLLGCDLGKALRCSPTTSLKKSGQISLQRDERLIVSHRKCLTTVVAAKDDTTSF